MTLVIVGETSETSVGAALFDAAQAFELNPLLVDVQQAYQAPYWLSKFNWHFRGSYPSRLKAFGQDLLQTCLAHQPKWVVTSGIAPVDRLTLEKLGQLGIQRVNFLTDDPWNPALRSPWFVQALPGYDVVFSPRRNNMQDLKAAGCQKVIFLPFGYNPSLFYPDCTDQSQYDQPTPDVFFAGGGDRDRVPYMSALIQAGLKLSLYGGFWERYPETKAYTKGHANVATIRTKVRTAKLSLCLVRQANRDGHCMRTFEVPAIGACMLTEDTPEHREIFGADGEAVVYFKTIPEMVEKAKWLLAHETERCQMAEAAHRLVTQGGHTYGDRLKTMLSIEPSARSNSLQR